MKTCDTCKFFKTQEWEYPCNDCKAINNGNEYKYVSKEGCVPKEITARICSLCEFNNTNLSDEPCKSCASQNDKPRFKLSKNILKMPDGRYVRLFFNNEASEPNAKDTNTHSNYDSHYNTSDHQPIEVVQANMTADEFIGYLKGNIIKYACRMGRKDDVKKEASKIRRYAQWLEQAVSGETIKPRK